MPALRALTAVKILRVVDGDTVEIRADIWLDQHVVTRVRLRDIDAPEMSGRCPDETRKAEAARHALSALVTSGTAFLTDLGRDKYGSRVLGRLVTSDGRDVQKLLLKEGHVRPYAGGRRQTWC